MTISLVTVQDFRYLEEICYTVSGTEQLQHRNHNEKTPIIHFNVWLYMVNH